MGRHREFDVETTLDAALAVFWKKGFEGASYDDLSEATGVARPGLYSAFGNKESFFRMALDRYDAKYMACVTDALDEQSSRQVVDRMLRGVADVVTRYPSNPGCLGVNGALACSDDAERVRQELIRRRAANEAALVQRLARARKEGDLPPETDCVALAGLVTAVSNGMAVRAKGGASYDALEAIVTLFLSTWPGSGSGSERLTERRAPE
jgi:AcrR family transcriptional regulator